MAPVYDQDPTRSESRIDARSVLMEGHVCFVRVCMAVSSADKSKSELYGHSHGDTTDIGGDRRHVKQYPKLRGLTFEGLCRQT